MNVKYIKWLLKLGRKTSSYVFMSNIRENRLEIEAEWRMIRREKKLMKKEEGSLENYVGKTGAVKENLWKSWDGLGENGTER